MSTASQNALPRWVLYVHLFLCGGLLIGMAAIMWDQPILADDWDFYLAITDWHQSRQLIPHPHAYVHLAQLFLAIFGQAPSSARVPGVLTGLVNLALIPALVYEMFGRTRQTDWTAIAAVWLYTLNPLTAQNMMLLDIDNTLLVPMLCVTLWLWKRMQDRPPVQRVLTLGLAFAIALWMKLPTPILVMGCIGLFHLLRGQVTRALEVVVASVGGGLVFAGTFALYGELTGFPFSVLNLTLVKARASAKSISGMLHRFPQGLGVFVLWLSFPLAALLLLPIVGAVARLIKRQLKDRDLFVVLIVVIPVFYMLLLPPAWGYPKYHTPLLPLIVILVARLFVPAYQALPGRARILIIIIGAGLFIYKLIVVGDPFYMLYQVTFETVVSDLAPRLVRGVMVAMRLAVPLIASLALVGLVSLLFKVRPLFAVGIVTLVVLATADMASTTAVLVPAQYSTRYRYTYDYGDLQQTIADLEEVKGGYALAVMDVLYYHDLSGERIYGYVCPGCSAQRLIDKIQSRHVDALVWTTKEDNRSPSVVKDPALTTILDACYRRVTHGVFIVYLYEPDISCSE
jgi:hypothetical protein